MAQPTKHKPPLDVLQSMINGILIEIGKALGSNDKESGRTLASGSARLQNTIPSAADNFHQALDELEIDILRAKAVIQRDLNKKREARLAKEAPAKPPQVQAVDQKTEPMPAVPPHEPPQSDDLTITNESNTQQPNSSVSQPESSDTHLPPQMTIPTAPMIATTQAEMTRTNSQQASNIPTTNQTSEPIGLGITTDLPIPESQPQDSAPPTAEENSAIDSLFDLPDTATGDDPFNFGDMDFSMDANNNQDPSQAANTDFDLSTFGNETQDFNMLDIPVTDTANTNNVPVTKDDDIFGDLGTTGDANMDLDLGNIDMGEGNTFDELFTAGDGDDFNTGMGEMEHGDIDQDFFKLE